MFVSRPTIQDLIQNNISALRSIEQNSVEVWQKAIALLSTMKGKLVIAGMGKSGHIAQKIAATFVSLRTTAVFLHPSEAFHGDLGLISPDDVCLLISHSGETSELLKLHKHLERQQIPVISITSRADSTLARQSALSFQYSIEHEGSPENLAPMASSLTSLAIGDHLASLLSFEKNISREQFAESHPSGALGLKTTKIETVMTSLEATPYVQVSVLLREALPVMSAGKKGIVAAVDEERRLIGVFTDGDLRRIVAKGDFSYELSFAEVITRQPLAVRPEQSLEEALRMMESLKVMALYCIDSQGRVCGIVHMHDIVERNII